jgi:hypothetical protein
LAALPETSLQYLFLCCFVLLLISTVLGRANAIIRNSSN